MSKDKRERTPRRARVKVSPEIAPRSAAADRLAALRTTGSPDFELIPEADLKQLAERDQDATAAQEAAKTPGKEPMSARTAIVSAALETAASPAQRRAWSAPKRPIAVVVIVPTTSWIRPVENYFDGSLKTNWLTFARDGSNKSLHKSDQGNDEVATALAKKRNVVGIAADVSLLPAALVAAADITVSIASPNGAVLRKAMRRGLKGKLPPVIDDAVTAGLDLDDLVAAFRPGSSPAEVIERLRAAAAARRGTAAKIDLPDLQTAVEYGAARTWGLALANDVCNLRLKTNGVTWSDIDRGAVLHSPPGFGKTLFAQILARKCQVPLVVFSVGELFAKSAGHLDGVIKAQRRFFEQAKVLANPVSLLFIDELDALPNRYTLDSHNMDWWLPVITDFMTQLDDAVGGREGIIVIGATNRIEAVDPAIMRPGRLERAIEIGLPDVAGVANIVRFHLKQDLPGVDLTDISELLEGATPAEIMEMVRSARRTARYAKRDLAIDDLRSRVMGSGNEDAAYLRRAAVHEAAHAVSAVVIPFGTLVRVQLRSRGDAGGHTRIEDSKKDLDTLADIEDRVTSVLAAAVAERIILGAPSIGSGGSDSSDLGLATAMLAMIHTSTALAGGLFHRCASEDALTTARADPRLRRTVETHLRALEIRAEGLVLKHRDAIEAVAEELAKKRHLSGDAVRAIVAGFPPRASAVRRPARRQVH